MSFRERLLVASTLLLPILFALVLGIPLLSGNAGDDSNYAIELTRLYRDALEHGHLVPRWSPEGNFGWGSPVFYYYGLLPSFLAGLFSLVLRIPASIGVALTLTLARLAAFLTCREWLSEHVNRTTATWGALLFMCFPTAALLNPTIRVAAAETLATAFLPWLLFLADHKRQTATTLIGFSLVTALLTISHLPQTMLGLFCICLYAFFSRGLRWGARIVLAGVAGLCLAGFTVLPALLLQKWTTVGGWNGNWLEPRNNMLFSWASLTLHRYRVSSQLCLYLSWLAGLAISVGGLNKLGRRSWQSWYLLALLAAMTPLATPLWQDIGIMHRMQFPWRLMPFTTLLASLITVTMAERSALIQRTTAALSVAFAAFCLSVLAVAAAGSFSPLPRNLADAIQGRLPQFVAWSDRDRTEHATEGSVVPEYVPASASAAGWNVKPPESDESSESQKPSTADQISKHSSTFAQIPGSLALRTTIPTNPDLRLVVGEQPAKAQRLFLHQFYFPGWRVVPAAGGAAVRNDPETGLVEIDVPAGKQILTIERTRTQEEREGDALSIATALGLATLAGYSRLRTSRKA